MMDIVWGGQENPQERDGMAIWCERRVWPDGSGRFGNCTTMGVIRDSELIAVMVYHNWQRENGVIEFSGASTSKRWMSREVLHQMFAYPFGIEGIQMLVTRNSPTNKGLQRMLKSYGFTAYRIPRLRGRDEDEVIHTLTIEDWRANRHERKYNGQEKFKRATAA